MKKRNKWIETLIVLISFILCTFLVGCTKGGETRNVSKDDIYPLEKMMKLYIMSFIIIRSTQSAIRSILKICLSSYQKLVL
jgi:hypothetical protein